MKAVRWAELRLMERNGKIFNLERQKPYELIPAQKDANGAVVEKAVKYVADFVYQDENGNTVIEDTKGYRKGQAYAVFVIKRKLLLFRFGLKVREV